MVLPAEVNTFGARRWSLKYPLAESCGQNGASASFRIESIVRASASAALTRRFFWRARSTASSMVNGPSTLGRVWAAAAAGPEAQPHGDRRQASVNSRASRPQISDDHALPPLASRGVRFLRLSASHGRPPSGRASSGPASTAGLAHCRPLGAAGRRAMTGMAGRRRGGGRLPHSGTRVEPLVSPATTRSLPVSPRTISTRSLPSSPVVTSRGSTRPSLTTQTLAAPPAARPRRGER